LDGSIDLLLVGCRSVLRLCKASKRLEVDITGIGHQLFEELCILSRLLVLCRTFSQLLALLLTDEVLLSQGNLGIADELWFLLMFMSSCIDIKVVLSLADVTSDFIPFCHNVETIFVIPLVHFLYITKSNITVVTFLPHSCWMFSNIK
jgi:hypothetical protein